MSKPQSPLDITPTLLLRAYASGVFPMSESAESNDIFWVDPKTRGILPLNRLHVSRSTRRFVRRTDFQVTIDTCFGDVVAACADRDETWINEEIFELYGTLHRLGYAHSVEVWRDNALAGGLYGVALGGAFFGESMFSARSNGSKIALIWLVARLRAGNYHLLDTQFMTDHLASLGAMEVTRDEYHRRLDAALTVEGDFFGLDPHAPRDQILQLSTQMS